MNTVRLGLRNFVATFLVAVVVVTTSMFAFMQYANAATTLTINVTPGPSAPRVVANNKIRFNVNSINLDASGLVGGLLDATKVHITLGTLTGASAVAIVAGDNLGTDGVIEVTFAGTPFSATNTSFAAAGEGLWVELGAFTDGTNENVAVASGGTDLAIYDLQSPTMTSVVTGESGVGLNKVTVTFSEMVDATTVNGTGWTVTGTDAGALTVTANTDPANVSTTMVLTLSGSFASQNPDATITYTAGGGNLVDASVALNELATGASPNITDGVKPTITSVVTGDAGVGLNKVTVTFSEMVDASTLAGAGWTVTGTDAGALTVTANTDPADISNTMVLTLSGSFASGNPDATVTYTAGGGNLADVATNELASGASPNITDGVKPTITSVVTGESGVGLNKVTITFSEMVDASTVNGAGWTVTGTDAGALTVTANTDPANVSTTMVLTLSGSFASENPDATVTYTAGGGDLGDVALNELATGASPNITDGVKPTITSVVTGDAGVGLNKVTVTFSEMVDASTLAGAGWTVTGTDAGALTVTANTDPADVSTTMVLTLSGSFASENPDATVTYTAGGGNLADVATNELASGASPNITDGIKPTFTANRTALNTIVLTFSENVDVTSTGGEGYTVADATVTANTDPAGIANTITLTTTGLTSTSSTPSVTYGSIVGTTVDMSPAANEVADAFSANAADGVAPTFTANRTALNTIVLTFTENVDVTTTNGNGYTVAGATVTANTDPAGIANTITLTTTGLTSTSSTPSVTYGSVVGTTVDASAALNEVANGFSANAADGVAPTFTANRTALNTIVLTFTENVDVTTTDGSGYTVAGATVTANTDPAGTATTITLTTTGLTSTSSTPSVTYGSVVGTTVDASAALNEVTNAFSANAADGVAPTFTANRTALNAIVLTFTETVTSGGVDTDSFTVVGASSVSASVVTGGNTITLTTTGLTSTSSTPAVNYVAATGDVLDASSATNEVANGGSVAAADGVAATISSTDITSGDGTKVTGDNVDIALTFSEAVTVTGSPRITLNTTNATRYATYLSGSGTTSIVFRYTVEAADVSVDLGAASVSALGLNSGTILDAALNAVTLTLPDDLTAANAVDVNAVGASGAVSGGGSGGSGSGGGGGGSSVPVVLPIPAAPAITPAVPSTPEVPAVTTELPTAAAPVAVLIHDPSKFDELLVALGAASKPAEFAQYKALVKSDALAFKVGLTDAQQTAVANFVTYGASTETVKLGAGERRAVVRDYFETVGRADVVWDDIQRMATGQKIVNRNLAKEQAQVNRVLANFRIMVGHTPNFKVPAEDIAWNTLMYRIRFPRDLNLEKQGIVEFKTLYNRIPSTPMEWSVVRALGYALK